jgi:glycosyltransferase involved in cell wall biosynthesis
MRLLMMTQSIDLDDQILGFTHEWVNSIAKQVPHLHVLCRVRGRHQLANNVTLHAFTQPDEPDHSVQRHLFFHRTLLQLSVRQQVDGILVHMIPKWVSLCWPYAFLSRIPLSIWYTHTAVSPALRRAHKLADHIFTASAASYPLAGTHVHAMGHGIDTNWFKPGEGRRENGRFHIIMPGRMTATKQPHLLINALHALPSSLRSMVRCQIMGKVSNKADQQYLARLHNQIEENALASIVTIKEGVPYPDMLACYQQADLVVNLSQTNSLDKTVLEGMACGVPVLSSNPACTPFLQRIDPRLAVTHGDAAALPHQLRQLIQLSAEERGTLGETLRQEVVQHHNLDMLMRRIANMVFSKG